jgi:hypothetical protein
MAEVKKQIRWKIAYWLIFSPYLICFLLAIPPALSAYVILIPESSMHTYPVAAFILILIGFSVGLVSLFLSNKLFFWWRILLGISYIPTTLISLLLAGF